MTGRASNPNNVSSLPAEKCFGCGACVNICPESCIAMTPDGEGFLYPQVHELCCIECRQCITTCPGFSEPFTGSEREPPTFFGGYIHDEATRYASSSGGIFSLLADHVLAVDGTVYGAAYDFASLTVVHARADDPAGLAPLRKSKYVQSDATGVLSQVRADLSAQRPVLFTGTPCQVHGLKLFLGAAAEDLLTCDIICHGVPSPGLFTSHFTAHAQAKGQPITRIDFRTKEKGWGSFENFFLETGFASGRRLSYALGDAYYTLFLANLSLRPCCYTCPYASVQRVSDLTIGDFWGVKKARPDLFDGKGTSLILINTPKGEALIHTVRPGGTLQGDIQLQNLPPNLVEPTHRPKYRAVIFERLSFENWHKQRWRFHLIAILTILQQKALGLLKRFTRQT